jgi:hypothetical protein
MPSIVIDLPIPIVPPFPGVPPLPLGGLGGPILQRAIGIGGGLSVGPGGPQLTPPGILATQDNVGVYRLIGQGRWGIFGPGGAAILTVDSVASIEYSKDFAISNYPQQKGGFMSYNKVEQPFMAKVGFLLSRRRATFLGQIGGWLKSLEFVSVATPEIQYPSANVMHFSYRRTSKNGVTMFLAEVWCEEVRVTATTDNSQAEGKSVNGQPTQQDGSTQPGDAAPPGGAGGGQAGGGGSNQAGGNGAETTYNTGMTAGQGSAGWRVQQPSESSTALASPEVGPAFYDGNNLPQVSSWEGNTAGQQQTMLNFDKGSLDWTPVGDGDAWGNLSPAEKGATATAPIPPP